MDSDIMNMMMQQMEKLPDCCTNPNPSSHNIPAFPSDHHQTLLVPSSNPTFYNPNQIGSEPIPQEPGFRYPGLSTVSSSPLSGISSSNSYLSVFEKRNTHNSSSSNNNNIAAMREMIFRIAVMQPIDIDPEAIKPPKRRNVRISKDPQSVAARHRRERISERIRILQRLVPGGTKMDTASMLDEAIHYVKFLKKQVQSLEEQAVVNGGGLMMANLGGGFPSGRMKGAGCGAMGSHQTLGNVRMLR